MKNLFCGVVFLLAATLFNSAQAVEVVKTTYLGNGNLNYPFVVVENPAVEKKINLEIFAEVERFLAQVKRTSAELGVETESVTISFEVPCNYEFGILSVVLTEYVYFEKAAHPATYRRALNFNSDSGQRIFASSLTGISPDENGEYAYSPKNLTLKLREYAEKNKLELYRDFQQLIKIPEDFYFDENLHVHFIFQQYEVAPYAAGIIEFDATPKK